MIEDIIKSSQVELLAAIGSFSVVVYLAISGLLEIMIVIAAFGKAGAVSIEGSPTGMTAQTNLGGQPEGRSPRLKISEWPCTTLADLGSLGEFIDCSTTDPSSLRERRSF